MNEELKQELLLFLSKIERTMREYNHALTSPKYIDPHYHMRNIDNIKNMSREIKKKVEEL